MLQLPPSETVQLLPSPHENTHPAERFNYGTNSHDPERARRFTDSEDDASREFQQGVRAPTEVSGNPVSEIDTITSTNDQTK